jgi:hypothetical protein
VLKLSFYLAFLLIISFLSHPFYLLLASSPSVTISNEGEIEGEEASNCVEIDACFFMSPFLSMLAYKQA